MSLGSLFTKWWNEHYCATYNYKTERDRCVALVAYKAGMLAAGQIGLEDGYQVIVVKIKAKAEEL